MFLQPLAGHERAGLLDLAVDGAHFGAGSVAHGVAGARSAAVLRSVPAGSRHLADEAVHAAAANGMAVLLAVAGLVGVAGALISFVMLGERRAPETATEARPEPVLAE